MTDNNEILELVENIDFNSDVDLKRNHVEKFTWEKLASLGIGVDSILKGLNSEGSSGIYYVETYGKNMFAKKGTNAFIGSLKSVDGTVGGGQALIQPVPVDPVTLMIAVAVATIDRKFDKIENGQKDIMHFLELKERAKIEADFNSLSDILRNYKYNWDNEKYKMIKQFLVENIKKEANEELIVQRDLIQKKLQKRGFIHESQLTKKLMSEVESLFVDYKKAIFLYAYSSFVEVLLQENYNEDYLMNVKKSISDRSYSYRELYSGCYDVLDKYSRETVEYSLVRGASKITTLMGKAIEKVPVISNTQLDENLIKSGEKIKDSSDGFVQNLMNDFVLLNNPGVSVFLDNIEMLQVINSKNTKYFIDKDNLYVRMMA